MKDYISAAACALVLLGCYAVPAQALQGLCSNSPENPTMILGMLCAAAAGYPYARERTKSFFTRKSRRDDHSAD